MPQRNRAVHVAAIGAALVLTGCSSGASSASSHDNVNSTLTSSPAAADAAITHTAAAGVMRGYITRNDHAIVEALNPPYDETVWKAVDSGPILAADAYDTKAARLKKSKQPAVTSSRAPHVLRAYGSTTRSSDGQKPWALVVAHRGGSKAPDPAVATASVYVKGATGWRMDAGIGGIRLKTLPAEAKKLPSLTAAQGQAAADAVPVVVKAVATGSMGHVAHSAPLKGFRTAVGADESKGFLVGADCRPWGTAPGTDVEKATVVGTDALRLARVGSRTLAVLDLDCRLDTYAQDGGQVQIPRDAARVEGDDGKAKTAVVRRSSLMILMSIPDHGKPKIIGADGTYLIPAGR